MAGGKCGPRDAEMWGSDPSPSTRISQGLLTRCLNSHINIQAFDGKQAKLLQFPIQNSIAYFLGPPPLNLNPL